MWPATSKATPPGLRFILAVVCGLAGTRPAAADDASDLELRRTPVPAARNAVDAWARAAKLWRKPPEGPARTALGAAWDEGAWNPSPEADRACEENREALALVDEGLALPEAQWPAYDPNAAGDSLAVAAPLLGLQNMRLHQARVAFHASRPAEGVRLLLSSVAVGQRMCEAKGALIHYMLGNGARTRAGRALRIAAAAGWLDAPSLESAAKAAPALDAEATNFATALRVDWTDYELANPDPLRDARRATEAYAKMPEAAGILVPEDLRRLHRIAWDPRLVEGHPKPLDIQWTRDRVSRRYHRMLADLGRPWALRDATPSDVAAIGAALLHDAQPLLKRLEGESFPLSKGAIARARPLYNRMANPLGRLNEAGSETVHVGPTMVFRARAEREALRGTLALVRWRQNHGAWPASWAEVVAEGLLPAPPTEPFGNGPLHYSREREVIWSVGEDGRDDGGRAGGFGRWTEPDVVWSLVPAPAKPRKDNP